MKIQFERYRPTQVATLFVYECCACDVNTYRRSFGEYILYPDHPGAGWRELRDGKWLCPAHELLLIMDGKTVVDA